MIVIYVVDLELTGIDVAQDHVVFAEAAEAAERAETHNLPIQSHRAQRARTYDVVVGNVIDLECAAGGVAQQHVAGVALVEIAERDKPPIASNLAKRVRGQDAVGPEVVDLIAGGGIAGVAQDHVGRRGGRRGGIDGQGAERGGIARGGDRIPICVGELDVARSRLSG